MSVFSCKRGDEGMRDLVENVLWRLLTMSRLVGLVLFEKMHREGVHIGRHHPTERTLAHSTWGVGKDGCKRYCMLQAGYPDVRLPAEILKQARTDIDLTRDTESRATHGWDRCSKTRLLTGNQ